MSPERTPAEGGAGGGPDASTVRGFRLTPFTMESELELHGHLRDRAVWEPYSWFGFGDLVRPFGWSGAAGSRGDDAWHMRIERVDGTLAGRVSWTLGNRYGGPDGHRGWAVGALVLPEHRGTAAGFAGITLLIDHLFTTTPANRIESATSGFAEVRSVREPAGMRFEGVMRGAQWRDGQWRDVAMYAVTRTDWQARRGHAAPPGA